MSQKTIIASSQSSIDAVPLDIRCADLIERWTTSLHVARKIIGVRLIGLGLVQWRLNQGRLIAVDMKNEYVLFVELKEICHER